MKFAIALVGLIVLLPSCAQQDPQTQLEKAVKMLSKKVPMRIDGNTTVTKIAAGKMKIIYTYEINGLSDNDVINGKRELERLVTAEMKKNKSQLQAYVKNKISMQYIYKNKKGKELVSFTLKPWKL